MSDTELPICSRCNERAVQCAFEVRPDVWACLDCVTDDELLRTFTRQVTP